jgi:hypothetical protein
MNQLKIIIVNHHGIEYLETNNLDDHGAAANKKQGVVPAAAVLQENRYEIAGLDEADLIFGKLFRSPSVSYG